MSLRWTLGAVAAATAVHFGLRWLRHCLTAADAARERDREPPVVDDIKLKDLGTLCERGNISLRKAAVQILLDRAMREPSFSCILLACHPSSSPEQKLRGATALELLVKIPENRMELTRRGCLPLLASCLLPQCSSELHRVALVALFDMVYQIDESKIQLANLGTINHLLWLLEHTHSKDVEYWALVLLHQLATHSGLRERVVRAGGLRLLVKQAKAAQGNFNTQKLCMHALVLLTSFEAEESKVLLRQIVDMNILENAILALRADDAELVYWSLALIHELSLKDVAKDELRAQKRIIKSFYEVMCSSDAQVQKVVLRTIGFLAIKNDAFKEQVLASDIPNRLALCLRSGEPLLSHWAIVLVHDLAMLGSKACLRLASVPNLLSGISVLAARGDLVKTKLAAETFGFFCSAEALHRQLVDADVLMSIRQFATTNDRELQFWAVGLLLNLIMVSDDVKRAAIQADLGAAMIGIARASERPQVINMALKCLVLLGLVSDSLNTQVQQDLLRPCIEQMTRSLADPSAVHTRGLNVLTLLLRNDSHKRFFLATPNMLETTKWIIQLYIAATCQELKQALSEKFGHSCVSCLKILCQLSSLPECRLQLMLRSGVHSMVVLLCFVVRQLLTVHQRLRSGSQESLVVPLAAAAGASEPGSRDQQPDTLNSDEHAHPVTPVKVVAAGSAAQPAQAESPPLLSSTPMAMRAVRPTATVTEATPRQQTRSVRMTPPHTIAPQRRQSMQPLNARRVRSLSFTAGVQSGPPTAASVAATPSAPVLHRAQSDRLLNNSTSALGQETAHPEAFTPRTRWLDAQEGQRSPSRFSLVAEDPEGEAPPSPSFRDDALQRPIPAGRTMTRLPSFEPLDTLPAEEDQQTDESSWSEDEGEEIHELSLLTAEPMHADESATSIQDLTEGFLRLEQPAEDSILARPHSEPRPLNDTSAADSSMIEFCEHVSDSASEHSLASALSQLSIAESAPRQQSRQPGQPEQPEQQHLQQFQTPSNHAAAATPVSTASVSRVSSSAVFTPDGAAVSTTPQMAAANGLRTPVMPQPPLRPSRLSVANGQAPATAAPPAQPAQRPVRVARRLVTPRALPNRPAVAANQCSVEGIEPLSAQKLSTPPPAHAEQPQQQQQQRQQQQQDGPPSDVSSSDLRLLRQTFTDLAELCVIGVCNCLSSICNDEAAQSSLWATAGPSILWTSLLAFCNPVIAFHAERTIAALSNPAWCVEGCRTDLDEGPADRASLRCRVELDLLHATPHLTISHDRLEVRNDCWTFETVMCNQPVRGGTAYFEVQVKSTGIIQVGWANDECALYPERGLGIGDDYNSIAFDGSRQRVWIGGTQSPLSRAYGTRWHQGDIVGCLLDCSDGSVSFFLNGSNLGVAFHGLDMTKTWRPAVSLTAHQQVRFNFGSHGFAFEVPMTSPLQSSVVCSCQYPEPAPSERPDLSRLPASLEKIHLYFEVAIRDVAGTTVGLQTPHGVLFTCRPHNTGERQLEVFGHLTPFSTAEPRCVLGCGVVEADADWFVFFTLNGKPLQDFAVCVDHAVASTLVPYLESVRFTANFGQGRFVLPQANWPSSRGHMARVWVDRCSRRLPSWGPVPLC